MSVELHIDDGNPWYVSPDIWTVPGDDPEGPPGTPVAGQPCYVWARVHNRGKTAVTNARVEYWWADPSTTISPASATAVGTAYVSLAAGETREVLCLTPWTPSWVNDGHLCLVARASAPADPTPPGSPSTPFDPPNDRKVAQRNLSILAGSAGTMKMIRVGVLPAGRGKATRLAVRQAPFDLLGDDLALRGVRETEVREFGLLRSVDCAEGVREVGDHEIEVGPDTTNVALVARVPDDGAALLLVEQLDGDRVAGGVGVLVAVDVTTQCGKE